MTPETKLKNKVQAWLKEFGQDHPIYFVKIAGSPGQARGTPDILGCLNGRMFALELKAPNGKPGPFQEKRLQDISNAGGSAGFAYSFEEARSIVLECLVPNT